jgi:acyl carrier protein
MTDTLEAARRHVEKREELLGKVRALLVRDLHVSREPDAIDPDTPLFATGLGLDSVDAVELVVCLQRELGAALADDDQVQRKTRTVNSIVDALMSGEVVDAG